MSSTQRAIMDVAARRIQPPSAGSAGYRAVLAVERRASHRSSLLSCQHSGQPGLTGRKLLMRSGIGARHRPFPKRSVLQRLAATIASTILLSRLDALLRRFWRCSSRMCQGGGSSRDHTSAANPQPPPHRQSTKRVPPVRSTRRAQRPRDFWWPCGTNIATTRVPLSYL